jgi:hypothetical protein
MNRNQKIALGCGGAGCLGLIVVVIAGALIYFFAYRSPRSTRNYNYNVSTNRNSNSNDNSDFTTNTNDNSNSANSNSSSSSDSTISTDEKHRLYHAAGMTGDSELIQRVSVKIGLMKEDYTPGDKYQAFVEEHASWVIRNFDFIQSVNTAEKARAYVNEHFPE